MSNVPRIVLEDVAALAIELYGSKEAAEYVAGRPLDGSDWRFTVTLPNGEVTFNHEATAGHVASYLIARGLPTS